MLARVATLFFLLVVSAKNNKKYVKVLTFETREVNYEYNGKASPRKSSLNLTCEFDKHSLSPLIIYKKYNDQHSPLTSTIGSKLTYHIKKLRCSDMGTYICQHKDMPSIKKYVDVGVTPCKPQKCHETTEDTNNCLQEIYIMRTICIINDVTLKRKSILHNEVVTTDWDSTKFLFDISPNASMYYNVDVGIRGSWTGDITFTVTAEGKDVDIIMRNNCDSTGPKVESSRTMQTTTTTTSSTATTASLPATNETTTITTIPPPTTTTSEDTQTTTFHETTTTRKALNLTTVQVVGATSGRASSSTMAPVIVLVVVVICGVVVFVFLVLVLLRFRGIMFGGKSKIEKEASLYDDTVQNNMVEEEERLYEKEGVKEERLYVNVGEEKGGIYENLKKPELPPGRYLSDQGLVYVTVDHPKVSKKTKKSRQTKKKSRQTRRRKDDKEEEDKVLYASLDYDKTEQLRLKPREGVQSKSNNSSSKTGGKNTNISGKKRNHLSPRR